MIPIKDNYKTFSTSTKKYLVSCMIHLAYRLTLSNQHPSAHNMSLYFKQIITALLHAKNLNYMNYKYLLQGR